MRILIIIFTICSFLLTQDVFDGLSLFTPGGVGVQTGTSTLLIDNDNNIISQNDSDF